MKMKNKKSNYQIRLQAINNDFAFCSDQDYIFFVPDIFPLLMLHVCKIKCDDKCRSIMKKPITTNNFLSFNKICI